jgi:hypothetical protein
MEQERGTAREGTLELDCAETGKARAHTISRHINKNPEMKIRTGFIGSLIHHNGIPVA